jgi:ATP-dependent helicase Lhr and Lhr-like helicase
MNRIFHPFIAQWFAERFGAPTPVQEACWPAISSGGNVLATAPTGSGKTLAAFLWFIDGMAAGRVPRDALSLLYVSPLKALNTDVRENLLSPLAELKEFFGARGSPFPEIRVMTRSGDSTPAERRLMLKRPPSILITTPESLAILVNSRSGEKMLSGVKALILDEIHAVAGTKRGAFLMCAVERLADVAGEFQRVALSATVRPLETAAAFVGGLRLDREAAARGDPLPFVPRPVKIIDAGGRRSMSLRVEAPGRPTGSLEAAGGDGRDREGPAWDDIARRLKSIISSNRSTIVFTNSRRVAEQACFLINRDAGEELAYVHHGSLSKELRRAVESRMREGRLRGIVATSSLELGIDIGEVDEVVLLGSPSQTAQALQRLGRSGHGPGRTVRGRLIPLHDMELLRCAILAEAVLEQDIDPLSIPENPLDVLTQAILGLCSRESRTADELFLLVRRPYNFRSLPRELFDAVIESLEGHRGDYRVRGIKRRLFKAEDGKFSTSPGTAAILAVSGGTIPDRGYYGMKLAGGGPPIGELDEEFVWERRLGEGFSLGNQRWRIVSISDKDVVVVPWKGDVNMLPFWKAERQWRSPLLSRRALAFLDEIAGLGPEALEERILKRFPIEKDAATRLASFIASQERSAGLPGGAAIAVERFTDPMRPQAGSEFVVHTLLGNGVNYPLMLALKETFRERAGFEPEAFSDNDCIVLSMPPDAGSTQADFARVAACLGDSGAAIDKLKPGLQSSGVFGASFRENAIRALMVARSTFDRRVPLWLMRARAKALLEEVSRVQDFPIVTETWRECLNDVFDMPSLSALLDGIADGGISLTVRETRIPSPFARGVLWQETNEVLYRSDASGKRIGSSLSEAAVKAAVADSDRDGSGPALGEKAIRAFEERVRRLVPGWAPRSLMDAESHLRDRVTAGRAELESLFGAALRDSGAALEIRFPEDERTLALERIGDGADGRGSFALGTRASAFVDARIRRDGASALIGEWSRFSGPFSAEDAAASLGLDAGAAEAAIASLRASGVLVRAPDANGRESFCDAQNLESLYRLKRRLQRPEIEARPADELALFLAAFAGIDRPARGADALRTALDSLIAWPARPEDWEDFLLPSRVKDYSPALLDGAVQGSDLFFYGVPRPERQNDDEEDRADAAPRGKSSVAFPWEFALAHPAPRSADPDEPAPLGLDARPRRFWDIKDGAGDGIEPTLTALWKAFFEGRAATNSFQALRTGIRDGFGGEGGIRRPERSGRARADRWKSGAPVQGEWFDPRAAARAEFQGAEDEIDDAESARERVNLVLKRHGVLFRSLLEREGASLRFGPLFAALRRMELSGEIVSGFFFSGIQGPQFMGPEGLRLLKTLGKNGPAPDDAAVYALSAADPASIAGLGIEGLSAELPSRSPQNVLVYKGGSLILRSRKGLSELDVLDGRSAGAAFAALASWLDGKARSSGSSRISVLSLNGENAASSPYAQAARAAGFSSGYRGLEYYPRA